MLYNSRHINNKWEDNDIKGSVISQIGHQSALNKPKQCNGVKHLSSYFFKFVFCNVIFKLGTNYLTIMRSIFKGKKKIMRERKLVPVTMATRPLPSTP